MAETWFCKLCWENQPFSPELQYEHLKAHVWDEYGAFLGMLWTHWIKLAEWST